MTISALLNRPCVIVRRSLSGDRDDFGNDVPTETTETTVYELQQTQRTEPLTAGELGVSTFLAVFPAGTDIQVNSAVVDLLDGHEYEVVGQPWAARNPRTQAESHVEATVRRTAEEGAGS